MSETIFPELAPPTYSTPETPATAPILKFNEWQQTEAEGIEDLKDQERSYFDYFRLEKFKRDELTPSTEADIRQLYFENLGVEPDLSEEERSQIGLQSTAFKPSLDQQIELVKGGYGEKEIQPFLDLPEVDQNKKFSDAKEMLVRRGQLSFASFKKDGKSFVQAGNYDKLSPNDISFAKQEALSAIETGALNPTDLWQVSQGLTKSGVGERSIFQNELDQDLLGKLQDILTKEASGAEYQPLTDALDEVITTKDEKSFFSQLTDDDPTSITQVLIDEDPTGIRSVQNTLIRLFNEDKGVTTKANFERISDSDVYTRDRVITLVQELAVRHANDNNEFAYTDDPKSLKDNIRRSQLGVPMADPRLMMQRDNFKKSLLQHQGLSDVEKDLLKRQREFYMLSRAKRFDSILSDFSATSDKWLTLKTSDPEAFKNNPVEVFDEFLSDDDNYKSFQNKALGVASSVKDALFGLVASVGALAGNQNAVDYLFEYQKEQQERAELANLFGDEMGTTYQVLSTATPMIADIGITTLLTTTTAMGGAGYVAAKTAAKKMAKELAEDVVKGVKPPMTFGKVFSKELTNNLGKMGYQVPALTTSTAARIFGNSYATIYSALPDDPDLSAEENHQYKRDRALGYGARAAVGGGLITAAFSALGFGGFESVFLRRGTFRQLKNVHDKFASKLNASYGGAGMSSAQFKKFLIDSSKRVNKELFAGLKGKGFIPLTLTRAAEEAVEEGLQEIFIGTMEEAGHKQDVPLLDLLHRGLNAAKVGGILGGAASAVRSGVQAISGKDTFVGDAGLFEAEQARLISQDRKLLNRLRANDANLTAEVLEGILLSAPARTGTGSADGTTTPTTPTTPTQPDASPRKPDTNLKNKVDEAKNKEAAAKKEVEVAEKNLQEKQSGTPLKNSKGQNVGSTKQVDSEAVEEAEEKLNQATTNYNEAVETRELAEQVYKASTTPSEEKGDLTKGDLTKGETKTLEKVVPSEALTEVSGLSTVLNQWQIKNKKALITHGIKIKPVSSINVGNIEDRTGLARVVANDDLSITLEVNTSALSGALKGSSDPYDTFQSTMGHEIIHALEFVHLRREYLALTPAQRKQQSFNNFIINRKREIYNSIEGSEDITEDIRREVVSLYLNMPIEDVVLPGETKYTAKIESQKDLSVPVYSRVTKKFNADLNKVRQSKPFFVSWEASDFELNWETENKRIGERIDGNNIGIYRYETTFEGDTNPTKYKIELVSTKTAKGEKVKAWELKITKKEIVDQRGLANTRDVIEPEVNITRKFLLPEDEFSSKRARNEAEKHIRERLKLPPKGSKKGNIVNLNASVVTTPFNFEFKSEPPHFALQTRQLVQRPAKVTVTEGVAGDTISSPEGDIVNRDTFDTKEEAEKAARQTVDNFIGKLKEQAEENARKELSGPLYTYTETEINEGFSKDENGNYKNDEFASFVATEFSPEQEQQVRDAFEIKVDEKKPQLNEELILSEATRMIIEARKSGDGKLSQEEKLMNNSKFPAFLQNILDLLKSYARRIAATISDVPKQLNDLIISVEDILADYNSRLLEVELRGTEMPPKAESFYFARLLKEASARLLGKKGKVRLTAVNSDKYQFTGESEDVTIERIPYANNVDLGTTFRVTKKDQDKWVVRRNGKPLMMRLLSKSESMESEVHAIFDSPQQASVWFASQEESDTPEITFNKVETADNKEEHISNAGIIRIVKEDTKFRLYVDGQLYGSDTNTDLNTFDTLEAAKEVAQSEWENLFSELAQPQTASAATEAFLARQRILKNIKYPSPSIEVTNFYKNNSVEVDESKQDSVFPEDTFNEGFRKDSKWLKEAPDQSSNDYVNSLLVNLLGAKSVKEGTVVSYKQIEYTPFSDTNETPAKQTSAILRHGNEIIMLVDVAPNVTLPFYIFNGQHDNTDGLFEMGKWYPFLGISESGGWMSKLDGFNARKGFDIDGVKQTQLELNKAIPPSIIDASQIPLAKFSEGKEKQEAGFMTHVSWINDVTFNNLRPQLAVEVEETEELTKAQKAIEKRYMAAVKKGDMDAADKALYDFAKSVGFNTIAWHGNRKGGDFTVFDDAKLGDTTGSINTELGHFFATSKDTAQTYNNLTFFKGFETKGADKGLLDSAKALMKSIVDAVKKFPTMPDNENPLFRKKSTFTFVEKEGTVKFFDSDGKRVLSEESKKSITKNVLDLNPIPAGQAKSAEAFLLGIQQLMILAKYVNVYSWAGSRLLHQAAASYDFNNPQSSIAIVPSKDGNVRPFFLKTGEQGTFKSPYLVSQKTLHKPQRWHAEMAQKMRAGETDRTAFATEDPTTDAGISGVKQLSQEELLTAIREGGELKGGIGAASIEKSHIWIIPDTSNIRSADTVVKDESGNVIPPSQRFASGKRDIYGRDPNRVVVPEKDSDSFYKSYKNLQVKKEQIEEAESATPEPVPTEPVTPEPATEPKRAYGDSDTRDPLEFFYRRPELHILDRAKKAISRLKEQIKEKEEEDAGGKPLIKNNIVDMVRRRLGKLEKIFENFGGRETARKAVTNFTETETLVQKYKDLKSLPDDQADVFTNILILASELELIDFSQGRPEVTESTPKKVELPPKDELVSVTKEQTPAKETIYVARVEDQVAGEFKTKAEADAGVEEAYQTASEPDVIPEEGTYELTPPTRKKPVKVKGFGADMKWYNEEVGGWFTPEPAWMNAWSAQMKDPTVATDETVEETPVETPSKVKVTKMGVAAYDRNVQDGTIVENKEEKTFTYENRKYKGPYRYPKSSDPSLIEGVEVDETASAPATMIPERVYEISGGETTASISQDQERVAQLANTAKTSALQFTNAVQNDIDPNIENGAIWFEVQEKETVVHVNPYGIHEITDGLAPQEAIDLVNAEVVNVMARASAMRALSNSDLDASVATMTDAQLDNYIDDVFTDEAKQEEIRQALNDPDTRTEAARIIIEGHLVNYSLRTLTGSSITQDRHFARSEPTFKAVVWNFFKKVLTRLYAGQRLNRENPTIALMVNRVVSELRVIKGGVRAQRNITFNPDEPDLGGQALIEQYQKDYETGEVSAPATTVPASPGDAPTAPQQGSPEDITNKLDFEPVITLLELPVAALGKYKKPKHRYFAGERDPRLQALYLQHKGYKNFIEEALGQFQKEYEDAVNDVFPDTEDTPIGLLRKAIGNASGVETEEFQVRKEEIINQYEEDQRDLSERSLSKDEYNDRLDEIKSRYKELISEAKADVIQNIKEDQQQALEEIRSLPNGEKLAIILERFRAKIDKMSEKFAEMQDKRSPELNAHLTSQLGIYITRSYKIFQDEGWISKVLFPENDRFAAIRQDGIDGLRANYIPLMINRKIEQVDRNPEKYEEYSDWTNLTTREKKEAIKNNSKYMAEIEADLTNDDQSILEDFMYYYQTEVNNQRDGNAIYLDKNRSVDSLRQKKYLPKYIRDLLGEVETPDFNLINTFLNVGNILNNHNFFQNIIDTGRRGETISDRWFLTPEELSTLSPEEQRTWIRVDDPKNGIQIGGVQTSIPEKNRSGRDQLNPFNNFIDTDDKRKKLFAQQDTIDGINTLRSQAADKASLGYAKKLEENINGAARSLTGYAMAGKTLGNVGFYIRNVVSNILFFGPAQGSFVNPFRIFNQVKTSRSLYTPDSIEEYRELLKGLFIIGDDVTSEVLSDLINNKITEESLLDSIDNTNKKDLNKLGKLAGKLAGKPIKFLAKQSALVDSFYKIARFEEELATFKKAQEVAKDGDDLHEKTLGQLQRLAAHKVLDTSQSFVRTTPAAKAMQNSILGLAVVPFVRFYMEVPRIMYNTIKVATQEMASGNAVLKARGLRRITGFATTVAGAGYIAPSIFRQLANITDEEEEVLREAAPNYSQTHTFFYTRVGDKLLSWDFTFVNPFAQMTDGGARFFEYARRGDMEKATELLLKSFIGVPFLQGQISTGAIIEAINDKDSFGKTISKVGDGEMENLARKFLHVFESGYEPPTVQRIRTKMFAASDADREEFLQTPYGMLLAEFLPAKPYEIDPNKIADKIFRKLSAQKAQLSYEKGVLKYDRPLSRGNVEDLVADQIDGLMTIADRALHYENGLKALGVSDKYYRNKLDKLLTKADAALLRRTGKIRSPQLSDSIKKSIRKVSVKYPDVGDRLRLWREAINEYGQTIDVTGD